MDHQENPPNTEPYDDTELTGEGAPPLEHESRLKRFLHHDMVGSGLLLIAALAALIVANAGGYVWYHDLWHYQFGFHLGEGAGFQKSLHHWVNDGLMAIFFFLVGMEIKRELLAGELASFRKALLPAAAALGGMVVPALLYAAFNTSGEGAHGWGIPMATDIAFAAGCIALMKKRVPPALMVFLVALAIVDDLGAVTVIAIFYTERIAFAPLVIGVSLIVISACMGQLGVRKTWPYVVIGLVIWFSFLQSGVHATIAGVLLAFTIPADSQYHTSFFGRRMKELLKRFHDAEELWEKEHGHTLAESKISRDRMVNHRQQNIIRMINQECHHVEAPLQRIEHNIEPFAAFVVMPIFAFANAGVHLEWGEIGHLLIQPVTLGVMAGLLIGKPLGIMGASWLAVKSGLARLPAGVTWSQLTGVSMLAAIGFTMSLFINELAFLAAPEDHRADLIAEGKIGIFLASILAAVIGLLLIRATCKPIQAPVDEGH